MCPRRSVYLVKLRHTVVSHQFNSKACRFWPYPPAWHRESLIRMRPVSSVGPQTEAAHSLRSWGDQIGLPTHISHNLLRQDHPQAGLKWIQQYTRAMQRKEGGWRSVGPKRRAGAVGREGVTLLYTRQQCDLIDSMPSHQFWLKWNEPLYVWKG